MRSSLTVQSKAFSVNLRHNHTLQAHCVGPPRAAHAWRLKPNGGYVGKCHCCYQWGQSTPAVGTKNSLERSLARGQPAGSTEKRTAQPHTAVDSPSTRTPYVRPWCNEPAGFTSSFCLRWASQWKEQGNHVVLLRLGFDSFLAAHKSELVPFRVF